MSREEPKGKLVGLRQGALVNVVFCMKVLSKLRDDLHEEELLRLSEADVGLGRMSGPYGLDEVDLSKVVVASRFGVEQGVSSLLHSNAPYDMRVVSRVETKRLHEGEAHRPHDRVVGERLDRTTGETSH